MSLSEDRTKELWQGFMPKRKEIGNSITTDLISMQVYDRLLSYSEFNDTTQFEKWAVVEVEDYKDLPNSMESYLVGRIIRRFCP